MLIGMLAYHMLIVSYVQEKSMIRTQIIKQKKKTRYGSAVLIATLAYCTLNGELCTEKKKRIRTHGSGRKKKNEREPRRV